MLDRLLHILGFAAIFAILGWYIPKTYFQYFDKTEYLKFESLASTDKKVYVPCEPIRLLTIRTTLIQMDVENIMTLVRINDDNSFNKDAGPILHFAFDEGERVPVTGKFKLPCDAEHGVYFYEGINKFKVQGNLKRQYYISEQFYIASDEAQRKDIEENLKQNLPPFTPRSPQQNSSFSTSLVQENVESSTPPQQINNSTTVTNPPPQQQNSNPQPTGPIQTVVNETVKTIDRVVDFVIGN